MPGTMRYSDFESNNGSNMSNQDSNLKEVSEKRKKKKEKDPRKAAIQRLLSRSNGG